jgi:hypothetical protein
VPFLLHAPEQVEQRAVERQQLVQMAAHEYAAAGAEQLLCSRIDEAEA